MISQFGQAEWLLELCKALGVINGHVFEAGAQSPHAISNSRCFIQEGWQATLVEILEEHCNEWMQLNLPNVNIFNKPIPYRKSGLDEIIKEVCNAELDVLFLDIDGSEYHQIDGLNSSRPKFICVEYDNAYPLNIRYVPKQMRHSVKSAQASSVSTYELLSQKGYVYLKSFFLDHIFIEESFMLSNLETINNLGIKHGFKHFLLNAPKHLYNIGAVLTNQAEGEAHKGIDFYSEKLENLINHSQMLEASSFYNTIILGIESYKSQISEKKVTNTPRAS